MILDNTYFTSINSCEKAYILGLIIFNIKENISGKIIIEIELKTDSIDNVALSYNNVDKLIDIFKKIGKVEYDNFNILRLTIESTHIIKDIFVKHLDLYLVNTKHYDLSLFINTIYSTDKNLLNNFIKAYIEKNGIISKNCLHIKLYNYNTLKQITTIYKIPHKILKEYVKQNFAENKEEQLYVLEYKNSNMIDFLGKIYFDDIHVNNIIYNFVNNNKKPVLKIIKVDEKAIIPNKNNYSDAGLDLTIIKEYKRLNSDTILYDTGIKLEIPNGYYVEIVPRSSISKSGYMLANNIGIIDQGYTGNLFVALRKINNDCEDLELPYKCCQIIMKEQLYPKVIVCDDKENFTKTQETSRGEGGFGSTGI